ncbi:MAG TPA: zf-HC2 domain-containing protein [Terriglobales bacterium]|jgi:anti-sigma factor RsiW|nr:zf-HC2 domain-containing protein [Terriglobales bacterium]
MNHDPHQQAQEMIACRSDGLSQAQQAWLEAHLATCDRCREYANAAEELVRALRSVPITAGAELVRTTQARARAHALKLQQQRERMWLIWISCAVVTLSTALTTPLLWQGFAWLGAWIRVPDAIWQTGFVLFWIAPALATSVLLAASGTFLGSRNGAPQG